MDTYTEVADDDFLVCTDCANHIANGEAGCCHNPEHETYTGPFAGLPCEVVTRMERTWRRKNILDVVLAHVEDDEEIEVFSTRTCESCGDSHDGNRLRAVATVRIMATVKRTFERNGFAVTVTQYDRGTLSPFYMQAKAPHHRVMGQYGGDYSGRNRYLALAEFVATIPNLIGA